MKEIAGRLMLVTKKHHMETDSILDFKSAILPFALVSYTSVAYDKTHVAGSVEQRACHIGVPFQTKLYVCTCRHRKETESNRQGELEGF